MIKTKVMDADDNEAESKIQVHRHHSDMHNLAEDVLKRVISTLQQNQTGCVYFSPIVTVSCPSPLPEFFRIVRNEQARWCRQAGKTFPQKVRRRASRWVSGGQWLSIKRARYMDRALCFTGILFIEGQIVPSHSWPKPAGATPTESRLGDRADNATVSRHAERQLSRVPSQHPQRRQSGFLRIRNDQQ